MNAMHRCGGGSTHVPGVRLVVVLDPNITGSSRPIVSTRDMIN